MNINFTKAEIDRLVEIHKKIEEMAEAVVYVKPALTPKMPSKNTNKLLEEFIEGREKYQQRLNLYKYQLFQVVADTNWENKLTQWINRICPQSGSAYNHYYDLISLAAYVSNRLPYAHPADPTYRMIYGMCSEFGYEKAYEMIYQLLAEEKELEVRNILSMMIHKHEKFLKHKNELVQVINEDELEAGLDQWKTTLQKKNTPPTDICQILYQLSDYVAYHHKPNQSIPINEKINDYLDSLYESKYCGQH